MEIVKVHHIVPAQSGWFVRITPRNDGDSYECRVACWEYVTVRYEIDNPDSEFEQTIPMWVDYEVDGSRLIDESEHPSDTIKIYYEYES